MSQQAYPQIIGNWWLGERLGSGYSGSIFKATHIHTKQVAALKLQVVDHECPTNRYERNFYPLLQGGEGMPTLFGSGIQGDYDYLVIELLGRSLDSLFRETGRKTMDLRSVYCIAMQVIRRLECMHNRGVLHRDIQLGNCVVGLHPHEKTIYMIDFGFSKVFIDPITREHIPDSKKKRDFIGNYWFSSVAVHCKGKVPARRDDMEALALMLIHLLTPGGLRWTRNGVPKTDSAHARLKRDKQSATPEELCEGLPTVFMEFLRYCRTLKFAERPDYEHWYEEFEDLAEEQGFPTDDAFVWPPRAPKYIDREARAKPVKPADVDKIMEDLAKLKLGEKPILGNRDNNIPRNTNIAKPSTDKPKPRHAQSQEDAIVLSSDDESLGQKKSMVRLAKAGQLAHLTKLVRGTVDNSSLAHIVRDYADILESSRSKTLTKEGFAFLDALYKQLGDPSIYIVPMRTSKKQLSQQENMDDRNARKAKLDKLVTLQRDVLAAKSNKRLAHLVSEFGACIDKTKNRTVTKDSIAFLNGLASTLGALS